eukprot:Clim_evm23s227 gene=Clim_evmTU23s227
MAGRIIAQLIVMGSQIITRAFVDAYRQAAAQGARNAAAGRNGAQQAANAAKEAGAKEAGAKAANADVVNGMSLMEARKILNVEVNSNQEIINKNFDHLFRVNDRSKGGSLYLQSKVVRAKERIDKESGVEFDVREFAKQIQKEQDEEIAKAKAAEAAKAAEEAKKAAEEAKKD